MLSLTAEYMRKYRGVGVDKQLKVVYNFLDMIFT